MALQKDIFLPDLPANMPANYIRYKGVDIMDRDERKATIIFSLFFNKEIALASNPAIRPRWGYLRLTGEKFDLYFSNAAMSKTKLIEQAYAAAKAEVLFTEYGTRRWLDGAEDV